jgi:hypothetical protein
MIFFIFLLLVLAVPAHASCGTNRTADPSDIVEVRVCAKVSQYVDTDSPMTEPEALYEMQAVSDLEPAAGDDVTESDTVYVDAPEDCPVGYVCQIENYE